MTDSARPNDYLSVRRFREAAGALWPVLGDGATAYFATPSLATSARFVQAIAGLAGIDGHPPDVDVRPGGVTVRLVTYTQDWFGMSERDVDLARRITAIATELGLSADSSKVQCVNPIVIGAVDIPRVMPFWEALMGYERRVDNPSEDLIDPRGRGPGIWFEQVAAPGAGRPRMHVAVWVPYEHVEARVAAAVAAGGRVIFDEFAPAWWTLADVEGNEADVATSMSRDEG